MAWTAPKTFNTGDVLPASDLNTHLRDNLIFLHNRGADLASATTVTPTHGFHKVTGTTTVDNIASPTDGHEVMLWFGSALTVRNNGGGTGNIRTSSGSDLSVAADTILIFRSDGTVWKQVGGTAGSVQALADSVLGSDTASFDFQNLAAGAHLQIILYGRTTQAATTSTGSMRLNNDSGANYDYERLRVTGAVATPTDNAGQTSYMVGEFPGASATSNRFGLARILIGHYANSTQMKAIRSEYGGFESTTGFFVTMFGGGYRSTSAITRVTLLPVSGNWLTASRASVYAMQAA